MYVIQYKMMVNGEHKTLYHADIYVIPPETGAINIYGEKLVENFKEARVFFERYEAGKVMDLFLSGSTVGKVLNQDTVRQQERNKKPWLTT